jgi:hypothetical protein
MQKVFVTLREPKKSARNNEFIFAVDVGGCSRIGRRTSELWSNDRFSTSSFVVALQFVGTSVKIPPTDTAARV